MYDYIIVGAGIYGLTWARLAAEDGKRVLVIEKRNHIGGNAYSSFEPETGIEVHKYGAHLFHTSNETVWSFVSRFTDFTNYVHRVYTTHAPNGGNPEVFPMPINLGTINQFFRSALSPAEAKALITSQAADNLACLEARKPANLAEQGVSLIGKPLFDAFIKNYTAKQWQTPAEELSPTIITRLPVRFNYDNRYFNNTHEGLPAHGYGAFFDALSNHDLIEVRLETDYFAIKSELLLENPGATVIYTGPIDAYFNYQFGELQWRSLDLVTSIEKVQDYQGCPVMNYADIEGPAGVPYTRIHEFKHFHPERALDDQFTDTAYARNSSRTVIVKEYPKTWTPGQEPYYPVNTALDAQKLAQYQELAVMEKRVIFGGRLGEYKYYDMDKVFENAINTYGANRG